MKERPVLFSAPMVRALLAGAKTQTRRRLLSETALGRECLLGPRKGRYARIYFLPEDRDEAVHCCPLGNVGDELWVRESIRLSHLQRSFNPSGSVRSYYEADKSLTRADAWPWKRDFLPSIHCPRGLSRIQLSIVEVRIERLQAISAADCLAEGIEDLDGGWALYGGERRRTFDPVLSFKSLWQSINGADSWEANPWVWALTFQRLS